MLQPQERDKISGALQRSKFSGPQVKKLLDFIDASHAFFDDAETIIDPFLAKHPCEAITRKGQFPEVSSTPAVN
jgi:hypothetical protein